MKIQIIISSLVLLFTMNTTIGQSNFNPSSNDTYTINSPFSAYDITNKGGSGIAEMGSRPYNKWKFEKVENNVYRLKEMKSGKYLHIQNSKLEVGDIQSNWWSAMWELEHVSSNYYRIKCKWNKYGKPLYLQNPSRNLTIGELADKKAKYGRWRVRKEVSTPTVTTVNFKKDVLYKNTDGGNMVFPDEISTSIKNSNIIWKINAAGHIEKSTNGGRTWTAFDAKLQEISAIDNNLAWGITWQGTLALTDGNSTLRTNNRKFKKFSAIDKMNAFASDARNDIYYTNNGGQTWIKTNGSANMLSAVDTRTVWMVNAGSVFRTNNTGKSWTKVATNAKSVSALNYNTAWLLNKDNSIQYTKDSGKSWYKINGYFHKVQAVSSNSAHAIDAKGDFVLLSL